MPQGANTSFKIIASLFLLARQTSYRILCKIVNELVVSPFIVENMYYRCCTGSFRDLLRNQRLFLITILFPSEKSFISTGVPGGSRQGPLQFIVFINDSP